MPADAVGPMATLIDVHLELLEVRPTVWRRLLIQDDISLTDMGAVLIGAMGWTGSHMFAYEIEGKRYERKFGDELDNEGSIDMAGVIARDVLKPGVEACFNYDFGDDWWLSLEVLEQRPIAKKATSRRAASTAHAPARPKIPAARSAFRICSTPLPIRAIPITTRSRSGLAAMTPSASTRKLPTATSAGS